MVDEIKVISKIDDYIKRLWDKDNGIGSDELPIFIAGMIKAKSFMEEEGESLQIKNKTKNDTILLEFIENVYGIKLKWYQKIMLKIYKTK